MTLIGVAGSLYGWLARRTPALGYTHCSLRTAYHLLLTTHNALLTNDNALLTTHYSLLTDDYSLLTAHDPTHCLLLTTLLTRWRAMRARLLTTYRLLTYRLLT